MTTTNKALITPAHGTYVDIWDQPVNADWATLDKALGSSFSVTLGSGGFSSSPAVISQANAVNQQLYVSGTITSPWVILLPQNVGGAWIVNNATSGNFTVTIGVGTTVPIGSTLVLQQGARSYIYTDGTSGNLYYANDRSTGSGATGAGGDQIFFLNGQEVTTSYVISSGYNAMTAGPIVIDAGVTVTVQDNQTWTIV
jgi:hypothetical protein